MNTFFSIELSKLFRQMLMPHDERKGKKWLTRVPHAKETNIYSHLDAVKCICVLFSLSFVYVFCRITNISMACVLPYIPQPIYTLTWWTYCDPFAQSKYHRKQMKTNYITYRCPLQAQSLTCTPSICWIHVILNRFYAECIMFLILNFEINKKTHLNSLEWKNTLVWS